jgi:signal transduction histidine kinase
MRHYSILAGAASRFNPRRKNAIGSSGNVGNYVASENMQLNSVASLRPAALGYVLAVLSVGVVVVGIPTRWQSSAPVSIFLLAVTVTAMVAGARPAMLAAAISLLIFGYDLRTSLLFIEPVGLFRLLALVSVAGAVIALTTRREREMRECAERLRGLSRRLFTVQEEERRHLARELHDEFGQVLVSIGMYLRAARHSKEAARSSLDDSVLLVQHATELLRSLVLDLRPRVLDSDGLDAALQWLAEQFGHRTGMSVEISGQIGDLPDETAIGCFRVVQEALTNVARHARAGRVWITLSRYEESAELVVRDNGIGFNVATTLARASPQGKLGLIGMTERAELSGGELRIDSQPGNGTLIRLRVPVPKRRASSA